MHAAYGHINKTRRVVSLLHVYERVSTLKYVIVFLGFVLHTGRGLNIIFFSTINCQGHKSLSTVNVY